MNLLDELRLINLVRAYKSELKDMIKGDQLKGLDIFSFKAFGKSFSLSLYIDCQKS